MLGTSGLPYSRQSLENLAVALGVNSAAIWFNPATKRTDLKIYDGEEESEMEEIIEAEE